MEGAKPPAQTLQKADHSRQGSEEGYTAVGRELLGFIWAIAIKAERISTQPIAA